MISSNLISKVFNGGRLFVHHSYIHIPLAGIKTKDAIQLPEKPKKPMTTFFRFVQEHKPILLKQNPELKVTEIVKKCAEDWKNVHPTVRERYESDYKSDMEVYAKKHLDYAMNLTDEQREYIKQLTKEKTEGNKKRRLRKKMRGMNKPKRPMSAFLLYLLDQSKKQGQTISELMKNEKGSWHLLDESEKLPYVKKAEQLLIKYKEDLENWEAQMLEEGHTELVRNKVLKTNSLSKTKKKPVSKKKKSKSSPKNKEDAKNE